MNQETKPGPATEQRQPLYWLRQRNGDVGTARLNAEEAAMAAQRSGAKGDYLSEAGIVWRERDDSVRGGYAYFTLTPIYPEVPGA